MHRRHYLDGVMYLFAYRIGRNVIVCRPGAGNRSLVDMSKKLLDPIPSSLLPLLAHFSSLAPFYLTLLPLISSFPSFSLLSNPLPPLKKMIETRLMVLRRPKVPALLLNINLLFPV